MQVRLSALILTLFLVASCAASMRRGEPPAAPPSADLLTVAERSDFKATSRYDEVVALLDALAAAHPKLARRGPLDPVHKTHEGRVIPMLIVADPPVSTPEEAAEQVKKGKMVALLLGNIHAGEVDGKEALPILAREILSTPDHPLLKDYVLLFVPIYNADGNERVGPTKDLRPAQDGPEAGCGIRENAQGFDLNRDFVKLEAPETRALVRALNRWDPAVYIDCHTTNGSYHRYTVTYEGPKMLAGDSKVVEFVRDEMFPELARSLEASHGWKTYHYGNFNTDKTKWESFPAEARYATNYIGLRNRIAVLSEGYSYALYKDRVIGTLDFCRAVLEHVAAKKEKVRQLIRDADASNTTPPKEADPPREIVIRSQAKAAPAPATLAGFVEETVDGRVRPTAEHQDYEVVPWTHVEPTLSVALPFAYVIPASHGPIVEVLQRHGVQVDIIREDIEVDAEVYRIEDVRQASRPFQGHTIASVDASSRPESRRLAAGDFLIRTTQKLGHVAAYLLEPACEDGLTAWNFFDESLHGGNDFPVVRIPRPTPILTTRARPLAEDRTLGKRLTFKDLEGTRAPDFSGSPMNSVRWLDDGEHYLISREGKTRKVHARTGRSEVFLDPDKAAVALAGLPGIDDKAAKDLAGRVLGSLTTDRKAGIVSHDNDLYYATVDGLRAARLTSTPDREEHPTFSPDGEYIAFVRKNNLFVVETATGVERALTTDGSETVFNGVPDWVYEEEIFNRGSRAYWWSPDSTRLAFLRIDDARVPVLTLVNDLPAETAVEREAYPRPGQANPSVRVGVVRVSGASPAFADLSEYEQDNHLVTCISWWPDSAAVFMTVQDRCQTFADVCSLSPSGGKPKALFRETTQAWVSPPEAPKFLRDGSFLFRSDRTGFNHAYHYAKDGKLIGAPTSGEWSVRSIVHVDEDAGRVYFSALKDNPIGDNVYTANLDGSDLVRLTTEPGSHRVDFTPKTGLFLDSWSDRTQPIRTVLRQLGMEGVVRTLDNNPVYSLEEFALGDTRQVQIPTSDGGVIEASYVLPTDHDAAKKYPVWFQTYAGPESPTIRDSWGSGQAYDHAMAGSGIIVFRADPRPASGKSPRDAWVAYKQLGVPELEDIKTAIGWLKEQPWCDRDRIGMSGHSYGGFITAYAMTHCDLFAAGIAGAPVTDWRDYDSIYTERYMLTPQQNPDGYDKTSVVKAAKNLHGRLLLVHGTIDDNVRPFNTTRFARALQDANKQFEMAFYPGSRHGIGAGAQYRRLQYDFMRRWLRVDEPSEKEGDAAAPSSESAP